MDWSSIGAAIGGSVISGLFGQSSAAQQFERQKELMALQHAYQVDDYKHRYQWAVGDMRSAGLNPIIAATSGIGGNLSGVSAGNAAMAPTPDFGNFLTNSARASMDKAIAKKGLELQERNTAVAEWQAANEEYRVRTDRMNVENQILTREGQLDLAKQAQHFDQQLREAWQEFQIDNETQKTGAYVRHLAAQNESLETMAQVALRDVGVKEVLADVARENGISHRALEAAQAVVCGDQSDFLKKHGNTMEAQEELAKAQTALTNYKRSVAGIETISDVMSGILSVAIGTKIGMGVYSDLTGNGTHIGF